jgi:hypothetical protein
LSFPAIEGQGTIPLWLSQLILEILLLDFDYKQPLYLEKYRGNILISKMSMFPLWG